MTEYEEKQLDVIKKVLSNDELFLRQNKKGDFYSTRTDGWWNNYAVNTYIRSGFSNRELPDIMKTDPEEVVLYFDYLFRKYGNNGVK